MPMHTSQRLIVLHCARTTQTHHVNQVATSEGEGEDLVSHFGITQPRSELFLMSFHPGSQACLHRP
jgi:hypothetical protein